MTQAARTRARADHNRPSDASEPTPPIRKPAVHVLLIEDDALVASGVTAGLRLLGLTVDAVDTAAKARTALAASHFDVCVLDLGLPDEDGMRLLARWRAHGQAIPVLVLTARDAVEHRVAGLRAGADDYLLKPFDLDELVARLHALTRRAGGRSSDRVEHGDVSFDASNGEVWLNGVPVELSRRELALLRTLLQNPGRILSLEQLQSSLYGFETDVESNAVNVHIHHLRRKLGGHDRRDGAGCRLPARAIRRRGATMTLRTRLVAIIGLSLALLWSVVALWMFFDVRDQLRGALDQRLAASARMVAGLVSRLPADRLQNGAASVLPLDVVARDGLACEVSLVRGEVAIQPIARTATSPGLDQAPLGHSTRVLGGRPWRTYVLQAGDVRIATADRIDTREGLLREIAFAAAVPFAVAMSGSLLLLWIGVGRGLAPIERVRAALLERRVDADAPLPAIDAPPELQPLIDTIHHLLLRVQHAIEHERRFTDDAAHELRTPLTAIKTHLQVLRLTMGDEAARGAAAGSLANAQRGVDRLQRTLEQLLLLARVEAAADHGAPVQTDALAAARQAIADAVAALPSDAVDCPRVELQLQTAAARLAVPESLLVSALRNLLDNALRHSPQPRSVVLRIEHLPVGLTFCVLDQGPGLSGPDLSLAPQRFWRRGGDGGSGLGLSIVEAIARRHHGELRLRPRQGGGLEARLSFHPDPNGDGAG